MHKGIALLLYFYVMMSWGSTGGQQTDLDLDLEYNT